MEDKDGRGKIKKKWKVQRNRNAKRGKKVCEEKKKYELCRLVIRREKNIPVRFFGKGG